MELVEAFLDARSWLFVPGDRALAFLAKAEAADADVLVLDLEDAVAPDRKQEARAQVAEALAAAPPRGRVVVRINGLGTRWWRDDVAAAAIGSAALMLPKTSAGADLDVVAEAMRQAPGRDASRPPAVVALVESARGVLAVDSLAAHPALVALALGGEDLAADLGVRRSAAGRELEHARGRMVLACAAAGRAAIDTPSLETGRIDLVAAEAARACAMGFSGMLAIHPRQIAAINDAFRPGAEDLAWARSVIATMDGATAEGRGVAVIDGRMVDAAVAKMARRILARSGAGPDAGAPRGAGEAGA